MGMPVRRDHVERLACGHPLHSVDRHGQLGALVGQLGKRPDQ
jgi:hypothetical protein